MDEKLLTAREVSEILQVSLAFAYELIRRGDIRSVRLGRAVRVRREDLEDFIAASVSPMRVDTSAY